MQLGDVTDRAPDSLKIVRNLQQLQREIGARRRQQYIILGNHEAMNLLGDNRYTTPGEYAAFIDGQSAARRDRIYDVDRHQLEAFYRAQNPKTTPEQIRAAWMAQSIRLAGPEHKLAWSPAGELGQWATRSPAILTQDQQYLFTHGK